MKYQTRLVIVTKYREDKSADGLAISGLNLRGRESPFALKHFLYGAFGDFPAAANSKGGYKTGV